MERPEPLQDVAEERIHDLDVRDTLRNGGEPFQEIMTAVAGLPEEGLLRLRAIFEPVPLYSVMSGRGFEHWTEKLADDDWRVWFWRAG